jgi:nitrogen regulatory protein PII
MTSEFRLHPKKRIEVIVEAPALHRLTEKLDRAGVTGYTVLPALAGRGQGGEWSREGMITETGRMVAVISIVDPKRADEVVKAVMTLLSRQIGVVSIGDVMVVRDAHF